MEVCDCVNSDAFLMKFVKILLITWDTLVVFCFVQQECE